MLPALSVVALAGMVAGIFGLYFTHALFATDPIPIAIQVGAVLLMIAARLTFGRRSFHAAANPTEGGLVTTGPYAYVRHPIYAAVIYFTWAAALDHRSLLTVACALLVSAGAFTRMLLEESMLADRYSEYAEYRRRVKRIVPAIF